jgi:hypothetical protein
MRLNPFRIIAMFEINKDWVDYEPETLWREIAATVSKIPGKDPDLDQNTKDMIMAVKLCFGSHAPYKEWEVFENVVAALNNEIPLIGELQEVFTAEVVFAVKCMSRISATPWSDEVKTYIAAVAHKDGLILMPSEILFAQGNLNGISHASDDKKRRVAKEWAHQSIKGVKEKIDYNDFVSVHCGKLYDIKKYSTFYSGKEVK